jgi:rhodanese-related sulfurtransferase
MAFAKAQDLPDFPRFSCARLLISKSSADNGTMSSLLPHLPDSWSAFVRSFVFFTALIAIAAPLAHAADSANMKTLTPEELVHILAGKGAKLVLFHVGYHSIFAQAHIPGSEYLGAGNSPEGLKHLRQRANSLPKNSAIVLYCGCCPWSHCPTVNPAYEVLQQAGFTNVKVLYIANNFGADWVDKGYPTAKGEQ